MKGIAGAERRRQRWVESGGRRVVATTTAAVVVVAAAVAAQGGEIFRPLREPDAGNECLRREHADSEHRDIAGD